MGEGYRMVLEYEEPAGKAVSDENRTGDRLFVVLYGSMEMNMEGKNHVLQGGDELFVPSSAAYDIKSGPSGCEYIVGEKRPA